MKKEDRRKLKKFELKDNEDFIIYLHQLITRIDKCITKYKMYLAELNLFILQSKSENVGIEFDKITIASEEYEEFMDKISNVQSYVLNLIGDSQKDSISYFKVRNIMEKRSKKNTLKFEVLELSAEYRELLNRFNKERNWINHVPESLLTAEIRQIKSGNFANHSLNPIDVNYYKSVSLEYVQDFYDNSIGLYKNVRIIHQRIKKDYGNIINENIRINRIYHDIIKALRYLDVAKMSADIQGL